MRCANQGEVLKCIPNKEGECIWNQDDDVPEPEDEAIVQQEKVPKPDAGEAIQSLDKPLTNKQALMIGDLSLLYIGVPSQHFIHLGKTGKVSPPTVLLHGPQSRCQTDKSGDTTR